MDTILPRLFKASITNRFPVDIIAMDSVASIVAMIEYCDSHNVRYATITEAHAARVLASLDGIGFGCYTLDGVNEGKRHYRSLAATLRMSMLANYFGVVSLGTPVEVSVTSKPKLVSNSGRTMSCV